MPLDTNQHYAVSDRPIDTNGHLNRAAICLYRADHLHIGPIQTEYLWRAAEHLKLAGQEVLAMRVEEITADGFGGNLRPVEDAVRELLKP